MSPAAAQNFHPNGFNPNDYLLGRCQMPPWFFKKKSRTYVYGDSVTVADGATGQVDIPIDSGTWFLVEAIHILPASVNVAEKALVQIQDTTLSQPWSNSPIPLRDISGVGDSPKYLKSPNILRPSSTLSFKITNNQGSSQIFYVAIIGRKVWDVTQDEAAFLTRRMWFQYLLPVPAVNANTTGALATLSIFNESDFLVKKILASTVFRFVEVDASAGTNSQRDLLMILRDTTSDVNLISKKLPIRLLAGSTYNGRTNPYTGEAMGLPKPMLLRRNSSIAAEFDNLSGTNVTASLVYVTFEGIRVFDSVG